MKFKCRKIRNVPKTVCTCEQKIAYNFAFMWSVNCGEKFLDPNIPEFVKAEGFDNIMKVVLNSITNGYDAEKFQKYNIDAIIVAFRQGFRKLCESPKGMCTSYEEIGEMFSIPYEIE